MFDQNVGASGAFGKTHAMPTTAMSPEPVRGWLLIGCGRTACMRTCACAILHADLALPRAAEAIERGAGCALELLDQEPQRSLLVDERDVGLDLVLRALRIDEEVHAAAAEGLHAEASHPSEAAWKRRLRRGHVRPHEGHLRGGVDEARIEEPGR